jgi:putative hydrolase of the HAD superfamily
MKSGETLKAIAFDFGETLAYSPGVPLSWKEHYVCALTVAFQAIGCVATPRDIQEGSRILEEYNTRIHPRIQEVSSDMIFARVLKVCRYGIQDVIPFSAAFFAFFEQNQQLYEDTLPILAWLQEESIAAGVLTDVPYGKRTDFVLDEFRRFGEISSYLTGFLTSVDVGERKPSPQGLWRMAGLLGVRTENLAYVGNEEKDIASAKAAGCTSVLISRHGNTPEWGQDFTFTSLLELKQLWII